MNLSDRQNEIITIVKNNQPISGAAIAKRLGLTKSTLRSDFAILTMTGILEAKPKVGYYYAGFDLPSLLTDKLYNTPVTDVMVPPVLVGPSLSIKDAITHLFMYDVGSLYVIDEDSQALLGIVSRKDLLRSALIADQGQATLAIVMTRMPNIYRIGSEETAFEAAKLIRRHQVDSLPVMATDDPLKIIGKVSKTSLLDFFIDIYER